MITTTADTRAFFLDLIHQPRSARPPEKCKSRIVWLTGYGEGMSGEKYAVVHSDVERILAETALSFHEFPQDFAREALATSVWAASNLDLGNESGTNPSFQSAFRACQMYRRSYLNYRDDPQRGLIPDSKSYGQVTDPNALARATPENLECCLDGFVQGQRALVNAVARDPKRGALCRRSMERGRALGAIECHECVRFPYAPPLPGCFAIGYQWSTMDCLHEVHDFMAAHSLAINNTWDKILGPDEGSGSDAPSSGAAR